MWKRVLVVLSAGVLAMCSKEKKQETAPAPPPPKPSRPQARPSPPPRPAKPRVDPAVRDTQEAKALVEAYTAKYAPLEKRANLAWWKAYTRGGKEAYQEKEAAELAIRELQSDRKVFARLKALREAGRIKDPLLRRQVELMYWAFLENQLSPELRKALVAKSNEVEQVFNTFRATIRGRKVTRNDIEKILMSSRSSKRVKEAWEASKQVGRAVAAQVVALVKLRNQAARSLGFRNYYEMQLRLNEQDPAEIKLIFDELDQLTSEAFRRAKARLDKRIARRFHVKVSRLMPWHYGNPFFQEVPDFAVVSLDRYFAKVDPVAITKTFYHGLGMEVDNILSHSDLYSREGKSQHAFCTDIDRSGDVRILANIKKNQYWTSTLLHEMGHGVYFEYIDRKLPFLLRQPAHIFTTEGVAMMFERVLYNPDWLVGMKIVPAKAVKRLAPGLEEARILKGLIFARWSLVMVNFERSLYENPDQDLNKLWWDLVERYQFLKRPKGRNAPDWAAKTHIVSAPAYYHNYMLGELFNSQLLAYIARHVVRQKLTNPVRLTFLGMPEVGRYLIDQVFAPGAKWAWQEYVRRSTGEPLSAKAFAAQYVHSK